ncbi:MAG: hypothetical protein LAO23_19690 [Acidobacteriia bacterium]|nr:hypothetical protein [Terriglobia bacterium]
MAREILGGFGPERSIEGNRASGGGAQTPRDVHNYSPPVGPSNVNDSKSPGIHGTNHGCCGTQGKH